MSKRPLLACSLIVCAMVGLTSAQALAADASAPQATLICTGMVPDDAFLAIHFCPRRVLGNESLAKMKINDVFDVFIERQGYSPLDLEQFALVLGPPEIANPNGHSILQSAIIGRFTEPHDAESMAAKWLAPRKVDAFTVGGRKCFRGPKDDRWGRFRFEPNVCFLDSRTFVIASDSWLPKVLGANDAKSQLISQLASIDPAIDATVVFTNSAAASDFIREEIPAKSLPGPLKPLGDLPSLLRAAKFSIRTNPEISLKLTLLGKDDVSADKMAEMIKSFQQLGQAFLPALQVPPGENIPAAQRESRELIAGMATKLIEGLVPHQAGKQVTVEIASLGTVDTVVGKLVMPAITAARGAAKRVQGMNNLKQLALAMFQCESTDGHFPAHAILSKEGKPLLSWRVYVLPYLEQDELFKQFHLDEPWDSANNKPLIAKMPAIFKSAAGKPLAEGQTCYVVPTGKNTIFDGDKGHRVADITDGTSNTILIVEAGDDKAVTWTKPDDMAFDPQKPLAGLGTIGDDGTPVAFADGSVRMIHKSVDAETFRRLILRNDGQPVDPNKF